MQRSSFLRRIERRAAICCRAATAAAAIRRTFLLALAVLMLAGICVRGDEAPSAVDYLGNVRRSGYTSESLRPPYRLVWTHLPRHRPRPAWHEPAWETQHIDQDYAFAVSAADGQVYFGSSADHAVHALDISTGAERWTFFTEGPVRFAPAVAQGRLYATSDDGYLYCLDASRGALIWKYRPAIPDERMIGNEQMISRWPARCGALVHGGRVYATFGMWSPEGIFVCCLDAQSGALRWQNDSSGTQAMCFPHYQGLGGTSPNGYLAMCGNVLVVPNGRATPAFFDADSGRFLYHQSEGLFPGGAWTMTYGDLAFTPCETLKKPNAETPEGPEADIFPDASLVAIEARTGKEVFHLQGGLRGTIADDGTLTAIGPGSLLQVRIDEVRNAAQQEKRVGTSQGHFVRASEHLRWKTDVPRLYTVIRAGDTLIAGGKGAVFCFNAASGEQTWTASLEGQARALLAARGRLFVSTTTGAIHCFAPGQQSLPSPFVGEGLGVREQVRPPVQPLATVPAADAAAAQALGAAGILDGYALVLGQPDAAFLASLAQRSNLTIYHPRPGDLHDLQSKLSAAGLYGTRIALHNVSLAPLPYAEYFANLVLVRCGDHGAVPEVPAEEVYRVLRPCGGVAVVSFPDAFWPQVQDWLAASRSTELAASRILPAQWQRIAGGLRIVRGPLPGAGCWTHQYADAGKSCASDEQLVRLPLRVLWFGGAGPEKIVSRHYRTPAPLAIDGRVFVPGIDHLIAMDAYNGRLLWERELPGVGHWPAAFRASCAAADATSVYALQGDTCLRLDAASGKTRFTYHAPAVSARNKPSEEQLSWEFLAVTGDAVIGTLGTPNIVRTWWSRAYPDNCCLFVLDKQTGATRWTYRAEEGIDSNGIACDGERLYLIDGLPRYATLKKPASLPRTLKALDLHTGAEAWHAALRPYENSLWVHDGVLLATINAGGPSPNHDRVGSAAGGGLAAFSAKDGTPLWKIDDTGTVSPVLMGGLLYLPKAYDLHTGAPRVQPNPFTGEEGQAEIILGAGCSKYAGCPSLITARSGTLGFFDLARGGGQYWYPNNRASCWINMIPACGLVLVPEGSSSCPCAYDYKTSLALAPATRQNDWCIYPRIPQDRTARKGIAVPLRRLLINCGAPGDRIDEAGDVWLAFPRPFAVGPEGGGGMGKLNPYDPGITMPDGGGPARPFVRNPDFTPIAQTDKPWLYTCGLQGPLRMEIPLAPPGSPTRSFRVTLMFCELETPPARRTFDVLLQGKPVLTGFDVLAEAKTATALAKEFTVSASDQLVVELRGASPPGPILNAIAIVAEP